MILHVLKLGSRPVKGFILKELSSNVSQLTSKFKHTLSTTMTDTKPKVEYRRLGASGLKISNPIVGTMSFGDPAWASWVLREKESLPILKAAYDNGITTWDTANVYSNGVSEKIIAKAIRTYNIPREQLIIMTKCFATIPSTYFPLIICSLFSILMHCE